MAASITNSSLDILEYQISSFSEWESGHNPSLPIRSEHLGGSCVLALFLGLFLIVLACFEDSHFRSQQKPLKAPFKGI